MPTYFQIGERKFALGTFERETYARQVKALGSQITRPDPRERVVCRVQTDEAKILAGHYWKNANSILEMERNLELKNQEAAKKEIAISHIYSKIAADPGVAQVQTPALFDTEH